MGSALAKVPSRLVVCRGPRAKYQVTLSVRPSTWQAPHEPQAAPFRDQRPSPVLKKRLPLSCASCAAVSVASDGAESTAVALAETAWVLRSTAVTSRSPSSFTKANA